MKQILRWNFIFLVFLFFTNSCVSISKFENETNRQDTNIKQIETKISFVEYQIRQLSNKLEKFEYKNDNNTIVLKRKISELEEMIKNLKELVSKLRIEIAILKKNTKN